MNKSNLLACLKIQLSADDLSYRKSSELQGVLFSRISKEYGDILHREQLHPYSQFFRYEDNEPFWYINTTSTEAYENIIVPLLSPEFNSFVLNNGKIEVKILKKTLITDDYRNLMDEFYSKPTSKKINIQILSYTSFKQKGRYTVTPDLRLIYQSLMMKYSAITGNEDMTDDDTLEMLVENSSITQYSLKTGRFPLEGQSVPGFIGNMQISFWGTETMMKYARMLFRFGEFSGVGIKTGMGMGAIRISNKEETNA